MVLVSCSVHLGRRHGRRERFVPDVTDGDMPKPWATRH